MNSCELIEASISFTKVFRLYVARVARGRGASACGGASANHRRADSIRSRFLQATKNIRRLTLYSGLRSRRERPLGKARRQGAKARPGMNEAQSAASGDGARELAAPTSAVRSPRAPKRPALSFPLARAGRSGSAATDEDDAGTGIAAPKHESRAMAQPATRRAISGSGSGPCVPSRLKRESRRSKSVRFPRTNPYALCWNCAGAHTYRDHHRRHHT